MRTASRTARSVLLFGAVALAACSSSGGGGTGGTGGKGTGGSGTGGSHTGGAGGSGTGGSAGGGGAGAGGAVGGAGGAVGGAGGAGCTGMPPVVVNYNTCMSIPGPAVPAAGGAGGAAGGAGAGGAGGHGGAGGFQIMSPDFAFCGALPDANTCNGHDFGTGTNPNLQWSGAPSGTMSYAIVFKDISLTGQTTPSTPDSDINVQHGYHWAMWDIPASVNMLASGSMSGYHSPTVSGAMQWSQRNMYGFFPPCPNPFPKSDARFDQTKCQLSLDSYSFTIYAFDFAHLPNLPVPDLNANGEPTGNYAANVGRYLESLSHLAVAEYRATSSAWASSFAPPASLQYPCAADDRIDGGTNQKDGGITIDGSALMCLE